MPLFKYIASKTPYSNLYLRNLLENYTKINITKIKESPQRTHILDLLERYTKINITKIKESPQRTHILEMLKNSNLNNKQSNMERRLENLLTLHSSDKEEEKKDIINHYFTKYIEYCKKHELETYTTEEKKELFETEFEKDLKSIAKGCFHLNIYSLSITLPKDRSFSFDSESSHSPSLNIPPLPRLSSEISLEKQPNTEKNKHTVLARKNIEVVCLLVALATSLYKSKPLECSIISIILLSHLEKLQPIKLWLQTLPSTWNLHRSTVNHTEFDPNKPLLENIDTIDETSKFSALFVTPYSHLSKLKLPLPILFCNTLSVKNLDPKDLAKTEAVTPLLIKTLNREPDKNNLTPYLLLMNALFFPNIVPVLIGIQMIQHMSPESSTPTQKTCPFFKRTILTEENTKQIELKKEVKHSLVVSNEIEALPLKLLNNHKSNEIPTDFFQKLVSVLLNSTIIGKLDLNFNVPEFVTGFIDDQANPKIFTDPHFLNLKAIHYRKTMLKWATHYLQSSWKSIHERLDDSLVKTTFSMQFPEKELPVDWEDFENNYLYSPTNKISTEQWLLSVTFLFIAAHETTAAILNNVTNHLLHTQYAHRFSQEIEPPSIEITPTTEIPDSIPEQFQEKYLELANDVLKSLYEITTKEFTTHKQFETFIKNLQNFIALMFFIYPPIPLTAHQTKQTITIDEQTVPPNITLILPIQRLAQKTLKTALDNEKLGKKVDLWKLLLNPDNHILFGIRKRPCWGRQFVLGTQEMPGELIRLAATTIPTILKNIQPDYCPTTTIPKTPTLRGSANTLRLMDIEQTKRTCDLFKTLMHRYVGNYTESDESLK